MLGSVESLKELVAKDPKILSSTTPQRNTALHIAAHLGHAVFAKEVLGMNEELLVSKNSDDDTPLHLAARAGKAEVAVLLIDRAKQWPEYSSLAQAAPEQMAARFPGGPLFMVNKEGDTPLHKAVKHRRTAVALKLLEAEHSLAHALNGKEESPLLIAAREGLADVVERITGRPWVDSEFVPHDDVSGTPLHQAVLCGHTRKDLTGVVEILLNAMPEKHIGLTNSNHDNVLHYAAQKNNARVVKLLLEKKPDLAYGRNSKQHSPLHVAARYGSVEAMKELLKRCPDVAEMVDSEGKNAFHAAIDSAKVDALQCLLRHVRPEEIVNRVDHDGNTPLHLAAKLSRIRSALMLIKDSRVNPCVLNKDGQTARSIMERRLGPGEEMDTYQLYLLKQLMKHEASRCRKDLLPPVATYQLLFGSQSKYIEVGVSTYTLVGTLIATVTFAASFSMPGGYSQFEGTAIHGDRAAFKIFVISNTVAMCCSIVVVFSFIWAWQDPVNFRIKQLTWAHWLTVTAGVAMVLSLVTAVYITISPKAQWPAYVVIIIGASTPAVMFLVVGKVALRIPSLTSK